MHHRAGGEEPSQLESLIEEYGDALFDNTLILRVVRLYMHRLPKTSPVLPLWERRVFLKQRDYRLKDVWNALSDLFGEGSGHGG